MRHLFIALAQTILIVMFLPKLNYLNAQWMNDNKISMLHAQHATVTGKLKIQGEGNAATIHYWHNLDDTISWQWNVPKVGNYRVQINYSLDSVLTGGLLSFRIDDQLILVPTLPTTDWLDYQIFDIGIINIKKAGSVRIILKGAQIPKGNNAALPDIAWISFRSVDESATSLDVLQPLSFQGKSIFDGKTFDGWERSPDWFRIEDGVIIGGSLNKSIPKNEFLCTLHEYGDFELRLKIRMVNGKGNGGVQFRSQRIRGSNEMIGYQADAGDDVWGGIWDESRRWRFLGTRLNEEIMTKVHQRDGWNQYIIRCEGSRVRLWLNGILTVDYIENDPKIPRVGLIGLQIHEGSPSEAWYKDIEIEKL